MPRLVQDILREQIEALLAKKQLALSDREQAVLTIQRSDDTIARCAAQVEALEQAWRVIAPATFQPSNPSTMHRSASVSHTSTSPTTNGSSSGTSRSKLKPTAAIMALIDERGTVPREDILALEQSIDTDTDNPRHLLQTTIYLLRKKGRIEETSAGFRRPTRSAN